MNGIIIKFLSRNYEIVDDLSKSLKVLDKNENKTINLKTVIQTLLTTFGLKTEDINPLIDEWVEWDKKNKNKNPTNILKV